MEAEVMIGKYSVSFVLTILLAFAFGWIAEDPATISNRVKKTIAVLAGIGLFVLAMFYRISEGEVVLRLPVVVDYIISGFLAGTSAMGINQLMKIEKKP